MLGQSEAFARLFFAGASIVINTRALNFVPTGGIRDTTRASTLSETFRGAPVSAADLE